MSTRKAANTELWRIESITIANFRGVMGTQTYKFAGLPALIWGENGVGKSTLALALEWILFGEFPSKALGAPRDSFMSPVGSSPKAWKGEVTFRRGSERFLVRRDTEEDDFIVEIGGQKKKSDEAAALIQELLGLDKETFVRAVLLQQSKIRGILLDEPRDRNKALDRLLGMEDAEVMLGIIKPKPFIRAADLWREDVKATEERFESQSQILNEQYESCNARRESLQIFE